MDHTHHPVRSRSSLHCVHVSCISSTPLFLCLFVIVFVIVCHVSTHLCWDCCPQVLQASGSHAPLVVSGDVGLNTLRVAATVHALGLEEEVSYICMAPARAPYRPPACLG